MIATAVGDGVVSVTNSFEAVVTEGGRRAEASWQRRRTRISMKA